MTSENQDQGYVVIENVLTEHECDGLLDAMHKSDSRPGSRSLFANPAVRTFAEDPRLTSIAETFLGSTAIPFKAILFDKSDSANWLVVWHQDRVLPIRTRVDDPEWGPWTTKAGIDFAQAPTWAMEQIIALRVHLDDSTEDNGPLRVIPGSHLHGVLDQKEAVSLANDSRHETCVVRKGGIIAMRPLLIHASSKSSSPTPRRVLHIEYAKNLRLSDDIQLAFS